MIDLSSKQWCATYLYFSHLIKFILNAGSSDWKLIKIRSKRTESFFFILKHTIHKTAPVSWIQSVAVVPVAIFHVVYNNKFKFFSRRAFFSINYYNVEFRRIFFKIGSFQSNDNEKGAQIFTSYQLTFHNFKRLWIPWMKFFFRSIGG